MLAAYFAMQASSVTCAYQMQSPKHEVKAAVLLSHALKEKFWTIFGSASAMPPLVCMYSAFTEALKTVQLTTMHQHILHRPSVKKPPSPVDTVDCVEKIAVEELAANGHLHLIEGVL